MSFLKKTRLRENETLLNKPNQRIIIKFLFFKSLPARRKDHKVAEKKSPK